MDILVNRIVAVLLAEHADKLKGPPGDPGEINIEEIRERLGPVTFIPGAINESGELVQAGQPWQAKPGGPPVILPPQKLNVRNWDGSTTVTQGPLGGALGFEMRKPR